MKNHILLTIAFCFTVLLTAQKKNYNVGILTDRYTEKVVSLRTQLQEQIVAVVGEDATITFPPESVLANDFNLQKAQENYNTLLSNDTDIIIAFGVVNNAVITKQTVHKKPTILFGALNKDLNGIDLEKTTSGIDNFTYLIQSNSFKEDLTLFKELTNFTKVGIIVERPIANILPLQETFDNTFSELDAEYKLIPYNTIGDITNNLDDIDAVYIAGGFYLTENEVKTISDTLVGKKLPSFTTTNKGDVSLGLMATNQSEDNINQFFRRVALSVESYVNGADLSELPIYIYYEPRLTINFNTAQAVGIPIKYSLIDVTDFVGDFRRSDFTVEYNVLSVIDQVLENNLSLQSDQKDVELSEQDVKTANSNYLPSLTSSASAVYIDEDSAENSILGQTPEFSTSGNVSLSQTLYSESAGANITVQKNLQKAQQEDFNAAQLDLVFDATNAYFTTLILKANAEVQLRNLELTKENLVIAQENFEAGEEGKSDVLRFQSELAQDTQSMVEAINSLEQGFVDLNQLLNNDVNTLIEIEDVSLDDSIFESYNYDEFVEVLDTPTLREPFIAFLTEEAKINAPELKSLKYNLLATERNIRLYSAGRFVPTLSLQGEYNRTFNRSGAGSDEPEGTTFLDDDYNISLNLSLPIFNQNLNNINKQTSIIQKDQLDINKQDTELAIAANIRNSVLSLVNEVSNIRLSKVAEKAAEESLELTQISYESGAVAIIELIDSQNNFISAQLSSISAVYNFLIIAQQLERNLGYYFLLNSAQDNAEFRQRFFEFLETNN
ncbi:MAG: TolC family protein [Bacteroidota bacterium]